MMQKILKNEKGSISLFVLLSALFFLVVVTSVGVSLKNKEASIDAQFEKTKLSYEKDVGNEEQVYAEESKKHTVTFNANGGSVDTQSKVVKLGETYGELPTPTRDGYTFKGWELKEILVSDYWEPNAIADATGINTDKAGRLRLKDYKNIMPSTSYSLNLNDTNNERDIMFRNIWYYDENFEFINKKYVAKKNIEFITPENCMYIRTVIQYRDGETDIPLSIFDNLTIDFTGIVSSDVIVTQDKDHTLTAIWEQNE